MSHSANITIIMKYKSNKNKHVKCQDTLIEQSLQSHNNYTGCVSFYLCIVETLQIIALLFISITSYCGQLKVAMDHHGVAFKTIQLDNT